MTETLVNGYSSDSTQRELYDEYQHDRVKLFFTFFFFFRTLDKSNLISRRVNTKEIPYVKSLISSSPLMKVYKCKLNIQLDLIQFIPLKLNMIDI